MSFIEKRALPILATLFLLQAICMFGGFINYETQLKEVYRERDAYYQQAKKYADILNELVRLGIITVNQDKGSD